MEEPREALILLGISTGNGLSIALKETLCFVFPVVCLAVEKQLSQQLDSHHGIRQRTERFISHVGANSSVHNSCVVCWKNFLLAQSKGMDSLNDILNVVIEITGSVYQQLGESQRHQIKENREYLSTLLDAILFLCKQELALRGLREGKTSGNKGNFLELLDLLSKRDSDQWRFYGGAMAPQIDWLTCIIQ